MSQHSDNHHDHHHDEGETRFIIGCLALSGIMFINFWFFRLFAPEESFTLGLTQILAAVIIALPVLREAWDNLSEGRFGMNELVLIAMAASCSQYNYLEAALIGIIMLLHELIEHWTPSGSSESLSSALSLEKSQVRKINEDGSEEQLQAQDLLPGDLIRIHPGDIVPVDAEVEKGQSTVNTSVITGESLPRELGRGSQVLAGSENLTGLLELRVSAACSNSVIARMENILEEARHSRSEIVSIIDRHSSSYAMLVLFCCAGVFYFSKDAGKAISLLIVSFPDALVMASPLAMLAALTVCARNGILLKKPSSFIELRNCFALFMDKTGTLSEDRLQVASCQMQYSDPQELQRSCSTLAAYSSHPVSRAIADMPRSMDLSVEDFREEHGLGISGRIGELQLSIGRSNWISTLCAGEVPPLAGDLSVAAVAVNGRYAGHFTLFDHLRPEARAAISSLKALGTLQLRILSGDQEASVARIAKQLDIPFRGECLPTEKAEQVKKAAKSGKVAFVGDGLNDAAAMAVADVGISMNCSGNELTAGSAGIILMRNDLLSLGFLRELSQRTHFIVMQNLICGVFFVLLGVFLAGYGLLPPAFAAVFHLLDAVFIVFNSARLLKIDFPELPAKSNLKSLAPTTATKVKMELNEISELDLGIN